MENIIENLKTFKCFYKFKDFYKINFEISELTASILVGRN